jgi:hypothetical protein
MVRNSLKTARARTREPVRPVFVLPCEDSNDVYITRAREQDKESDKEPHVLSGRICAPKISAHVRNVTTNNALLELPLAVVQRAHVPCLEPPGDAVEVEGVLGDVSSCTGASRG